MKKIFLIFLTISTALLARAARSWACAVCLGGSDGITDGYNASVLFLLSTPYLVGGAIAGALIWTYRRAHKRQVENAEAAVTVAWKQEESGR